MSDSAKRAIKMTSEKLFRLARHKNPIIRYGYNEYMAHHYVYMWRWRRYPRWRDSWRHQRMPSGKKPWKTLGTWWTPQKTTNRSIVCGYTNWNTMPMVWSTSIKPYLWLKDTHRTTKSIMLGPLHRSYKTPTVWCIEHELYDNNLVNPTWSIDEEESSIKWNSWEWLQCGYGKLHDDHDELDDAGAKHNELDGKQVNTRRIGSHRENK